MRITEFIDLITRKHLPEEDMYSHLEYRDEEGKLLKRYRDLRKEYKKGITKGRLMKNPYLNRERIKDGN